MPTNQNASTAHHLLSSLTLPVSHRLRLSLFIFLLENFYPLTLGSGPRSFVSLCNFFKNIFFFYYSYIRRSNFCYASLVFSCERRHGYASTMLIFFNTFFFLVKDFSASYYLFSKGATTLIAETKNTRYTSFSLYSDVDFN